MLLAIYLFGFAIMFVWQWKQPTDTAHKGGDFTTAFAMALWWPVLGPIILIRYLASLAGYDI